MVITRWVVMLATVALATPALCLAQSERGNITGVVQDSTKGVVPGVRINPDVRRFWNPNENISIAKSIKASERLDMDIRIESFNVFNRVIWDAPNTDFSSNNFGLITRQANLPRQMQVALKLYW